MKTGKGVRKQCCLSPILFALCNEHFTNSAFEGSTDLEIVGHVIRNVKYSDDLVLLVTKKRCYRA